MLLPVPKYALQVPGNHNSYEWTESISANTSDSCKTYDTDLVYFGKSDLPRCIFPATPAKSNACRYSRRFSTNLNCKQLLLCSIENGFSDQFIEIDYIVEANLRIDSCRTRFTDLTRQDLYQRTNRVDSKGPRKLAAQSLIGESIYQSRVQPISSSQLLSGNLSDLESRQP